MRLTGRRALPAAAIAFFLSTVPASVHPHVFAEARLDVVLDQDGTTVKALRHLWRFDDVFSSTVLMEFDQNGDLKLDDTVLVTNRFRSIVDGSAYELSIADDSDAEVYRLAGRPIAYRALNEAMITVSSNLAANILIDRLDPAAIRRTMAALGASGIEVLRGVEDQEAFDKGLNNTTDASALATLFWKLGRGEVAPALGRLAQARGNPHLDFGPRFEEAVQPRHQPARGERRRRAHGKHAAAPVRAHPFDRLRQGVEPLAQLGQAGARGVGQLERAVVAVEQLHAQRFLQRLDLVAHRRGRDVQLGCGFFHAGVARSGLEGPQGIERGQAG